MGGQRHAPAALTPRIRPGTHCVGGWVGPRAGVDGRGKSRPIGVLTPYRPARSESLYRLRRSNNNSNNNVATLYVPYKHDLFQVRNFKYHA